MPGLNVQVNLLGVQRPSDHPHDPVSHRPGEPGSVRGEVHAPGLTSRPALQGRGAPGLQLQDKSRVGRWMRTGRQRKVIGWQIHPSLTAARPPPTTPQFTDHLPGSFVRFCFFFPRRFLHGNRSLVTPSVALTTRPKLFQIRVITHMRSVSLRVCCSSSLFSVEHIVRLLTFFALTPTSWTFSPLEESLSCPRENRDSSVFLWHRDTRSDMWKICARNKMFRWFPAVWLTLYHWLQCLRSYVFLWLRNLTKPRHSPLTWSTLPL